MKRIEFPRKIRAQAFERSKGRCENEDCGAKLKVGEGEYDHVIPLALGGESTLENCQVLCRICHKPKTADDIGRIRKADRQRDKHNGTWKRKPFPGGKGSKFRKKISGEVVPR